MSKKWSFKEGEKVQLEGTEYVITDIDEKHTGKVRFRQIKGSRTFEKTLDEVEAWSEKVDGFNSRVDKSTYFAFNVAALNENERTAYEKRLEYVKKHLDLPLSPSNKQVMRTIEETFSERTNKYPNETKPDKSTVYKWVKIVSDKGYLFSALAFKDHRSQPRKSRIHPKVEEYILEAINLCTLNKTKFTASDVLTVVKSKILEENEIAIVSGDHKLNAPSKKTIKSRVDSVNKVTKEIEAKGIDVARKKFNYGGKTNYPHFIGSIIVGDTNELDVFVFDPILNIVYKPNVLLFLDLKTDCIVGYELSYLPKGKEKLSRAITNVMSADKNSKYGCIPCVVIVDNGYEFKNSALNSAGKHIGFTISFAPPKSPNAKKVERTFDTLNNYVVHKLPGTTRGDPALREDYDPEKHTLCTLEEIIQYFDEAIEAYHCETNSGRNQSPATIWNKHYKSDAVRTYPEEYITVIGSEAVKRSISDQGRVTYKGLYWHSPQLPDLKGRLKNAEKIELCINPDDLTNSYVRDPRDPTNIILCDPVDPRYQKGLTLFLHQAIVKELKDEEEISGNPEKAIKLKASLIVKLAEEAKTNEKDSARVRARKYDAAQKEEHRNTPHIHNANNSNTETTSNKIFPIDTENQKSTVKILE